MSYLASKEKNSAKSVTVRTVNMRFTASVIRERRLRWFGHVYRMDFNRMARQAMDPSDFKKQTGRPRVSWTSTIKKDLDLLGLAWEEALDLMKDRSDWRDCTARCAFENLYSPQMVELRNNKQ